MQWRIQLTKKVPLADGLNFDMRYFYRVLAFNYLNTELLVMRTTNLIHFMKELSTVMPNENLLDGFPAS